MKRRPDRTTDRATARPGHLSVPVGVVLTLAAFVAITSVAPAAPRAAAEPEIDGLAVHVRGGRLAVDLSLTDAVDHRLLERVDSGLPTGFVYRFELVRVRRLWWDKRIAELPLEVTAVYDAVEREYLVHYKLDGELVETRMVETLPELTRALTHLDDVPLFSLAPLPRDWRLKLRVRAEMGARALFSLIPASRTTPWVESRRFRRPRDLAG